MVDRIERINDVRDMLDFLETHPDVPMPSDLDAFDAWEDGSTIADVARALGHCEKEIIGRLYVLRRRFGGVRLDVNFPRNEVCTGTVVGTRTVPEKVIPARTEDIVEWECPDSILDRPDTR